MYYALHITIRIRFYYIPACRAFKNGKTENETPRSRTTYKVQQTTVKTVPITRIHVERTKNGEKAKATPGLPMWSPTIVLTGLDRA